MKDIVKVLNALSFEGFKACIESSAKREKSPNLLESVDGVYFATPFTGYLCWNSNMYNFYGAASPYTFTRNMATKDGCNYELHYVETIIRDKNTYIKLQYNNSEKLAYINNKIVPKALKSVITDKYTQFFTTEGNGKGVILVYSEPYTLAYLMPTIMKEDKKNDN